MSPTGRHVIDKKKVRAEQQQRGESEEKRFTWGNTLLLVACIVLMICGLILTIYCARRLVTLNGSAATDLVLSLGFVIYGAGLAAGLLSFPPGILGVVIARTGRFSVAGIVAAAVALLLVLGFALYCLIGLGGTAFSIGTISGAMVIFPIIYLVACIKIAHNAN